MNTKELEPVVAEIESLIKTYLLCTAILTIFKHSIKTETKNQCLIELRSIGFDVTQPTKTELKKIRAELKQIKNRVIHLKKQFTPIQQHIYKSRLTWTF